jgi:hypothetical protein
MVFVASCLSLPPNILTGDEPGSPPMAAHGMVMPEGRLAVYVLLIKLVNI